MSFMDYFSDAVLRAPTIASMLMGLTAGAVGTVAVLRREALIGEVLSHAAYPGLILGIALATLILPGSDGGVLRSLIALCGGFVTALLGIYAIHFLQEKLHIASDPALCSVLAATFGVGVTLASQLQFSNAAAYRETLTLLYGQAATMTDFHIALYGGLALLTFSVIILFYKEIQLIIFDRPFALSLGLPVAVIEGLLFFLIALTVIVGIRTIGVVLMSAMLIAPSVAARQFTHHLWMMLLLSALFGSVAGFLGNYLSVEGTLLLSQLFPRQRLSLPTGAMIALTATLACLLALLLAPERGLLVRVWRIMRFRRRCLEENILKYIWHSPEHTATAAALRSYLAMPRLMLSMALFKLKRQGWLYPSNAPGMNKSDGWSLSGDGVLRAGRIVRLHRLWEVYLVNYLGVGAERVHCSAEEMEHIITPELEDELTVLLADPVMDPHHQPIPPKQVQW